MKDDTEQKMAIYKLQDFIKNGTNVMEQKVGTYTGGQNLDVGQ